MDIQLEPELQEYIKRKIQSGQSLSADEVVRDALWMLLDSEKQIPEEDIEDLRMDIAKGLEQIDRGESEPWDLEKTKARFLARQAKRKRAN